MDFITEDQKIELFTRCIAGKSSSSEYKDVYEIIQQNPDDKALFDTLYSTWLATGLDQPVSTDTENDVWDRINRNKGMFGNKLRTLKTLGKVAAVALILVSLGLNFGWLFKAGKPSGELMTIEAPKGAKSLVTLLDGTTVILNSGSKIQYSADYNKTTRDIFLSGEAYFTVAKNKSLPFKVHTGKLIIKAIGTVFNVKAYPDEKSIETTLVEGLISIENTNANADSKLIYLKPNQHAVYFKTRDEMEVVNREQMSIDSSMQKIEPIAPGNLVLTPNPSIDVYTSWKDKQLVFKGERFGDFTLRLERLYDTEIKIADPEISQYKITGSIEQENLEMVMKALQLIVPIDYTFENNTVTIYANKKLKSRFDQTLTQ